MGMATLNLLSIFPKSDSLLATTPEDLGGIIIELMPSLLQGGRFNPNTLMDQIYPAYGPSYHIDSRPAVLLAICEAISWLTTEGLLISDPTQSYPGLYVLTRRAKNLKTRIDVDSFRKGRILPNDLLPTLFSKKIVPLFRRGDHDTAVFQAFKEIEVAVRNMANAKGAGYTNSEIGTSLMRKAFHPENGPLTDMELTIAEREAESNLFAGAIGHAKNPPSHRDVAIAPTEAARLIVFASYLFEIVERRAEAPALV